MRTIGVVTTSRADYGIVAPVLRAIVAEPEFVLQLFVSGTHLAPSFGLTVRQIERDGFPIAERIECLLASDSPLGVAQSMGLAVAGFAAAYARARPQIVLVTGDRFEMHAAALAALPFGLPVAHLHGGELSAGAIDDALRHSLTKLCALHFTATDEARERVIQLGEEPWRVVCTGAPALDALAGFTPLAEAELARRIGMPLAPAPLLVTFHPVTLQSDRTADHVDELLAALTSCARPVVFTLPNADPTGSLIRERIEHYVAAHPASRIADNLGTRAYFSLLGAAAAMVGNSSSGLIEAPSFGLPVVNVGDRQAGRLRARNVIDAPPERAAIAAAIERACAPSFRADLRALENPYGRGDAAGTIVRRLREVALDERLRIKRFFDLAPAASHV